MANSTEIIHEHTIYAEPIFHIGDFAVTNALMNSWVAVLIVIALSVVVNKKISIVPRGLQNLFESSIELMLGLFDSITGSRDKTNQFFPFVFSFFLLILIMNWSGILPGSGSVGMIEKHNGESFFVPFLRGGSADVNTTLALAIIGVVSSHIIGVLSIGVFKHFGKFINLHALAEIPSKIRKDPMVLLVNPIKFCVGILEIIGEIAKVISLTFRLFGNIFAGEVLLASMSAIAAFALPIPFLFMEVLVGLLQALIFAVLVLSYLSMATTAEEH